MQLKGLHMPHAPCGRRLSWSLPRVFTSGFRIKCYQINSGLFSFRDSMHSFSNHLLSTSVCQVRFHPGSVTVNEMTSLLLGLQDRILGSYPPQSMYSKSLVWLTASPGTNLEEGPVGCSGHACALILYMLTGSSGGSSLTITILEK